MVKEVNVATWLDLEAKGHSGKAMYAQIDIRLGTRFLEERNEQCIVKCFVF